jgi:hypothetical protein
MLERLLIRTEIRLSFAMCAACWVRWRSAAMNGGTFTFVIGYPPDFERHLWQASVRDSDQRRRDRIDTGKPWPGLCAADHHHRDGGLPKLAPFHSR